MPKIINNSASALQPRPLSSAIIFVKDAEKRMKGTEDVIPEIEEDEDFESTDSEIDPFDLGIDMGDEE